jgi:hypothetical protein
VYPAYIRCISGVSGVCRTITPAYPRTQGDLSRRCGHQSGQVSGLRMLMPRFPRPSLVLSFLRILPAQRVKEGRILGTPGLTAPSWGFCASAQAQSSL